MKNLFYNKHSLFSFISFQAHVCSCFSSGVIAVSWYPPSMRDDNGESMDDFMPLLLEVAHKYHIKVCMTI